MAGCASGLAADDEGAAEVLEIAGAAFPDVLAGRAGDGTGGTALAGSLGLTGSLGMI